MFVGYWIDFGKYTQVIALFATSWILAAFIWSKHFKYLYLSKFLEVTLLKAAICSEFGKNVTVLLITTVHFPYLLYTFHRTSKSLSSPLRGCFLKAASAKAFVDFFLPVKDLEAPILPLHVLSIIPKYILRKNSSQIAREDGESMWGNMFDWATLKGRHLTQKCHYRSNNYCWRWYRCIMGVIRKFNGNCCTMKLD